MNGWQLEPEARAKGPRGYFLGMDFHEWLVSLVMLTSFYVKSTQGADQAAPFDLMLVGTIALLFALGLRFPRGIGWPTLLWGLVIMGYGIGGMYAVYEERARSAFMASVYLVGVFLFFASFISKDPDRRFNIVMNAYSIAAVFAALTGIAGYFGILPPEQFTDYGRASGTFNDPNVFGPYLIAPAIYLGMRVSTAKGSQALLLLVPLGILVLGLLLSFSRGAWGGFLLAGIIFMGLTLATSQSSRQTMRLLLFGGGMALFLAIVVVVALSTPQIAGLFAERASLVQEYDVNIEYGRFESQARAFMMALQQPWGIGQGQWAMINRLDTHNVYLHVLVSGGFLAGFAFLAFMVATIWRGWRAACVPSAFQGALIVVLASVIAHFAEAAIIDIDNWRHFFVMLGMLWGGLLSIEGRKLVSAGNAGPVIRGRASATSTHFEGRGFA
ncbi:MAG: hypothetical protein GC184_12220 [Rhizobiales bacterium]|nr:hypothetical protein [Hyphomicrobiales bacterium]